MWANVTEVHQFQDKLRILPRRRQEPLENTFETDKIAVSVDKWSVPPPADGLAKRMDAYRGHPHQRRAASEDG